MGKRGFAVAAQPRAQSETPCPSDVPDEIQDDLIAYAEWMRVYEGLEQLKTLTVLDRTVLLSYCCWYSRWQQAKATLKKEGLIRAGQRHPCVKVEQDAWANVLRCARELGLTPGARTAAKRVEQPRLIPREEMEFA